MPRWDRPARSPWPSPPPAPPSTVVTVGAAAVDGSAQTVTTSFVPAAVDAGAADEPPPASCTSSLPQAASASDARNGTSRRRFMALRLSHRSRGSRDLRRVGRGLGQLGLAAFEQRERLLAGDLAALLLAPDREPAAGLRLRLPRVAAPARAVRLDGSATALGRARAERLTSRGGWAASSKLPSRSISVASSRDTSPRPRCVFQMTNPQPGSLRLFHDVHPKARLFSTILPPQSGVGQSPIGSGSAPGSSPVRSSSCAISTVISGLPRGFFQITNPQPGSVFEWYDVQPNERSRSTISPPVGARAVADRRSARRAPGRRSPRP